ncbi:adhesin [Paenibacillus sp. TRM 82003]|nr:adhesin [Paenibacillus sp. TRM 82003]
MVMQITDNARDYLQALLEEHECNGMRLLYEGKGCSGPKIGLALDTLETDEITKTVNGIAVAIEEEIIEASEKITLEMEDSKLFILGSDSCC